MTKIIDWILALNLFVSMATFTKDNFDVYVDNKLDSSISVYKLDNENYVVVLLSDYSLNDWKGIYYIDLKEKTVNLLRVKKLEFKDNGKTIKINKSAMEEDLNLLQMVDHDKKNLKISNDEIRFTPDLGLITQGGDPTRIDRIHKKEVILRKRQTAQ
jgi:hypothetical protein